MCSKRVPTRNDWVIAHVSCSFPDVKTYWIFSPTLLVKKKAPIVGSFLFMRFFTFNSVDHWQPGLQHSHTTLDHTIS
jgi:hypothetical protein